MNACKECKRPIAITPVSMFGRSIKCFLCNAALHACCATYRKHETCAACARQDD